MSFTHLHVHSHYSLLDGLSKVEEIVDKCLATGMMSVALTDHGNMYGIKDLLDYCKKINKARKADGLDPFKPIVGVEAYCARRGRHSHKEDKAISPEGRTYFIDRSGYHLILLAKNMTGYHNLCRIVSAGYMSDAYYYTPRIDRELLEKYHEGIICSSACLGGELPQKILEGIQTAGADRVQTELQILSSREFLLPRKRRCSGSRTCSATIIILNCSAMRPRNPARTWRCTSGRNR